MKYKTQHTNFSLSFPSFSVFPQNLLNLHYEQMELEMEAVWAASRG